MVLDASIPLRVNQFDLMGTLENGSQLAQHWQKQKTDAELNNLYKQTGGDLDQMMQLGQQSKYANLVMPQLQAQKAASQKASIEQQKTLVEIGKTQSESLKNNQMAAGEGLKNAEVLLGNANKALYAATQTGDQNAVLIALNNGRAAGALDDATYQQYTEIAKVLGSQPEKLKAFALNIQQAYAKDPEKYNLTTADNRLDNQTSIANNQLTNQTSLANNQLSNQTTINVNNAKLQQDQSQFDAELYVKQNKPLDYFTAQDGTRYAVYANGQGIPISNGQGGVLKEKPKNAETPTQKMERQEKTIDFSVAAQGAAEGSKLAATLANDLGGLNSASGASPINWAARKIPGTEAFNYVQKLETLKANVFLSQVSKMKGMGALTEAEGARLEKAIASLDANQDSGQLQKNLTEIAKQLSVIAKTNSNKTKIYAGTSGQAKPQAQQDFDVKSFFNE